ncbi:purine-cytosine permease [Pholiota molesta]|nr:purine-cytosine permease [Pholiota molesta]
MWITSSLHTLCHSELIHKITTGEDEQKTSVPLDVKDVEKDSNDCDTPVRESQEHEVSDLKVGEDDKNADALSDENVCLVAYLINMLTFVLTEQNHSDTAIKAHRSSHNTALLGWFTCNFNILAFGTGSAGPAFFGLGIKASLVILLILLRFPIIFLGVRPQAWDAGYACTAGHSERTDVLSMMGFLVLNGIIGGQTIAADYVLRISCFALFETYAWIPNLIAFPILLGLGGKHLNPSTFIAVPTPSASAILSFSSFVASSVISWCTLTPDYGVYHNANASERRIFIWTYLGFFLPSITWHMMGAAFAAAAPGIPAWQAGFDNGNNVGGLVMAVLAPAKGFGKFVTVMIALSTSGACLSAMAVAPFFARVPRYVLVIISEAIFIPLAIIGAKKFYSTLVDILSVIGYWSTIFAVIVLTEHFLFRRRWAAYDVTQWNKFTGLPPGIAAVFAFLCGFGIIVPSMKQTWYTGPIARAGTGDIGIITGGVVALLAYIPLRAVERRIWPRR